MKYVPFIAEALLNCSGGDLVFDQPVQRSLFPDYQALLLFALRLHQATRLHFDLRFKILSTLLSFVLLDDPSLDPDRPARLKLMYDHDPKGLTSERVIQAGMPGAGPTMPVDFGGFAPIIEEDPTYEMEFLRQVGQGDFRFMLHGLHLKGAWQIFHEEGLFWKFRKLEDEYASTRKVLRLDRSAKTGKSLSDL